MRKIVIVIEARVNSAADKEDVLAFTKEALETWGGQRHPNDPLFNSLTVTKVKAVQDKFKFIYW